MEQQYLRKVYVDDGGNPRRVSVDELRAAIYWAKHDAILDAWLRAEAVLAVPYGNPPTVLDFNKSLVDECRLAYGRLGDPPGPREA